MDADKDGIIGKNDLRAAFDSVGKIANDKMVIDDKNQIDTASLIEMLTGKGEEEEEEAA